MTDKERQEARAGWRMQPVALLRSPYKEKFGIPRQPGLVDVECSIEMLPGFDRPEMVEGLEGFSHLWLSFVFHACAGQGWKPRVRPPRLGGNRRVGVFASRSPFRPNYLGLSVVELVAIESDGGLRLKVRGADLLDGTPILDIKPYVPYVDAIPDARAGFAPEPPPARLAVRFGEAAIEELAGDAQLVRLIEAVLAQDPRPAYQQDDPERVYGVRLAEVNVRFRVANGEALVIGVEAPDDLTR
jgi:tRNA-Thr(GGU) m(6)t(6)A37 methyltransferase TsaA